MHFLQTFVFFSFLASLRDWVQISLITSVNCSVAKFTPSLSVGKVVVSDWHRRKRKSSCFRRPINFPFETSSQMNCFRRLNVSTWGSKIGRADAVVYKLYRYVPSHRVGFLRCFGLKTGLHFANFGLESGVVFEGTTGVYERIYCFNSKWVRKKEKYANSKWIWRIFFFALKSK